MIWIYHAFSLIFLPISVYSECMPEFYKDTFFKGGDISSVFAPDVKYCQTACTYDPRCLFFTYLPADWKKETERFACFLKDSDKGKLPNVTLTGAISGYSLKQCNPKENGCTFELYTGLDMIGTNYNVTTEYSEQKCEEKCTNNIFCQFFTYTTNNFHSVELRNKCYLKYSLKGTPTRIRILDNVVSGFSLKVCGVSKLGCMSDTFQEVEFSGDNITSVFAPDFQTCQKICTFYPNCLFFTFFSKQWNVPEQRYLCFLKTSKTRKPTHPQEKQNAISGFSLLTCKTLRSVCHSPMSTDVEFLGDELDVAFVNGETECQQFCTNTIRCQFFTYMPMKGECRQNQCKCHLRLTSNGFPTGIQHAKGGISGFSKRLCKIKTISGCGQQAKGSRITGGSDSSAAEWPWQLSLHIKISTISRHVCGGSIINNWWIVTAAHCIQEQFKRSDIWIIYAGISNQTDINETTPFYKVKQIIIHPLYREAEIGHDIALFRLETPIPYNDNQIPICLPSKEFTNSMFSTCWISGWGYTNERGKVVNVLQKAEVPLISNEECQASYVNHRILNLMACAGYEQGGIDACKGDSGGPLVCEYDKIWYLIGITSWGEGCGRPGQPGVYTKVTEFRDWILETTK
ncbi:plasma kallikrein [Rhinatrema bivittatum]|uniref:plasma kallikrein n=1 Tax=Rhinatrema bivittatum TaxID=194408 RepID=UPI0011262910|nr:plasma kallikrein [Rhinatrema bivittatum]